MYSTSCQSLIKYATQTVMPIMATNSQRTKWVIRFYGRRLFFEISPAISSFVFISVDPGDSHPRTVFPRVFFMLTHSSSVIDVQLALAERETNDILKSYFHPNYNQIQSRLLRTLWLEISEKNSRHHRVLPL